MNKKFQKYLIRSILVQIFFASLAVSASDMGETIAAFTYAAVAYWTGILIINIRRPNFETKTDHMFMRSGLIVLSLFSYVISLMIWTLRGKW